MSILILVTFMIILYILIRGLKIFILRKVSACDNIYIETKLLSERSSTYNPPQKYENQFHVIHYKVLSNIINISNKIEYEDSYELYKDGKPHLYCLFPYQLKYFTRKNILVINGYVKQFKYLCIFARLITNNKKDLQILVANYVINDKYQLNYIFQQELIDNFYKDYIIYSSFIYKCGKIYAKRNNTYEPYIYLTALQLNQLSKLCQIKYLENDENISLFKVQLLTDKLESKRIISKLRWININNKLSISNERDNYERTKKEKESI